MGLDQWLIGKVYLSRYDESRKALRQNLKEQFNSQYEPNYVEFEILYWRKANAIHRWFVQNVQGGVDDCRTHYVSREQLMELLEIVLNALASKQPETILPTEQGFFFGSNEYDEYYRENLERTAQGLKKLLADTSTQDMELYYSSSW